MHAASQRLSSYGLPGGANMGPNISARIASGTIPSQKTITTLSMARILSILPLAFEHPGIVQDLNHHPDIRATGAYDPSRQNQRFQVPASDECEASMACTPDVNSDGDHNARI
jgi:hypothetical protein